MHINEMVLTRESHSTGGGSGEELATHEQVALDVMTSRGSHLINGIEGAFESAVSTNDASNPVILAEDTQGSNPAPILR